MDTIRFRLVGTTSLFVSQTAGLDPFNPAKQALAALTAKRKKTLDDHREIQRAEWMLGMQSDAQRGGAWRSEARALQGDDGS